MNDSFSTVPHSFMLSFKKDLTSDMPISEECSEQVKEYFCVGRTFVAGIQCHISFLFVRDLFCGEFLEKQSVRLRHRRRNWLPLTQRSILLFLSSPAASLSCYHWQIFPPVQRHAYGPRSSRSSLDCRPTQHRRSNLPGICRLSRRTGELISIDISFIQSYLNAFFSFSLFYRPIRNT